MNGACSYFAGALALELAPGSVAAHLALTQDRAHTLTEAIGQDLHRYLPSGHAFTLAVLAAHFDATELLQPGWPLYRDLDVLARRAPGAGARLLAIGSHAEHLPASLRPDEHRVGAALRLVPFVISGAAEGIEALRAPLEAQLLETGMAGASCALYAQDAFAATIEHARYLTLYDLLALTAQQYEHAGLAALWPLLETALLATGKEVWLDAPPEPPALLRADGSARIGQRADASRAERARARQWQAVLQAHAIPCTMLPLTADGDLHTALAVAP